MKCGPNVQSVFAYLVLYTLVYIFVLYYVYLYVFIVYFSRFICILLLTSVINDDITANCIQVYNSCYSATVGERNIAIGLSVRVFVCPRAYLWNRWTDFHEFLCRSVVAVARSSSGGVTIRYALPVLWMTYTTFE